MSKDKLQLLSPLFLKYQSDFEKNPRSRVFAPLAESYRKLGMTDKAMEILSQGIRYNPGYVMGYLGLAFCYFDLRQFNLAYTTLRPLIEANRDNLRLQKLFADTCIELGKQEEALETFKYLLFINPRDKEVAELVTKLEREIEERYRPAHKPIIIPESELTSEKVSSPEFFDLDKISPEKSDSNDFDDWMTIDLSHETKAKTENKTAVQSVSVKPNYDQWNVKKSDQVHEPIATSQIQSSVKTHAAQTPIEEEQKPTPVQPKVEDSRAYQVHLDLDNDNELDEEPTAIAHEEESTPLVTHTLVDLYCGQGHIEKALEVLEKILILNPNDQKTIKKIKEIQALAQPLENFEEIKSTAKPLEPYPAPYIAEDLFAEQVIEHEPEVERAHAPVHLVDLSELDDVTEEDGRRHLMSLIDEKLGPIEVEEDHSKVEVARQIEEKLTLFLKKIQKRALDYQGRV